MLVFFFFFFFFFQCDFACSKIAARDFPSSGAARERLAKGLARARRALGRKPPHGGLNNLTIFFLCFQFCFFLSTSRPVFKEF